MFKACAGFGLSWAFSRAEASCLLKKGASGLQSMWLEAGDYKEKITTQNEFGILKVEEKKLFFYALSRLLVRKILLDIENSISLMVQIKT